MALERRSAAVEELIEITEIAELTPLSNSAIVLRR